MDKNKAFVNDIIKEMTIYEGLDEPLVPYAGAKIIMIGLLFLKAIIDKSDIFIDIANLKDKEDYVSLLSFTRMFTSVAGGYDVEILTKMTRLLEKYYNLPQGILEIEPIKKALREHWFTLNENFTYGGFPSDVDYSIALADLISRPQDNRDTANTYKHYTNESLQHLVAKILDVKKTETFMDCCCGMFSSALYNDAADYIGIEQDKNIASIAAMILIMCQKKFTLKCENFIEKKYNKVADKILADISYGIELPQDDERTFGKNGEATCIGHVLSALKEGGKAAIICSGSFLAKQDDATSLVRSLLTENHLKAVIALPPMSNGTKSNTNLIILEKNCRAKEIKFIDASNFEIENQKRLTLSESDITEIGNCLEGKESSCLFKDVKAEDVSDSAGVLLVPSNYVGGGGTTITRPIEEIDKELNASYEELKTLLAD